MKRAELLRMSSSLLKVLSQNGIKISDVSFIDIYDDYVALRDTMKYSAAISELSIKYGKSERTISRMMAKLAVDVDL